MMRTKVEHAVNKLRQQALRCAGLIVAPILLFCFVTLMGQYTNSNPRVRRSLSLPEVISQSEPICRQNAIAYMVRKEGSFGSLVRSLDHLYENYLNEFHHDAHVFLFHVGDFKTEDLQQLEWRYSMETRGTIQLVNLANTPYWQIPDNLQDDDQSKWAEDVARLHENRFWSIKVWDYFGEINRIQGCNYRHIMRMHPESYIYSPIKYNLFDFMQMNNYQYGYRLCSYEMASSEFLWDEFSRDTKGTAANHPKWSSEDCAFYNPFFVADLQFFLSSKVQRLLQFVDKGGYIYRNDMTASVVHTMAIYAYSSTETIHRFLDFTFEHFRRQQQDGCPQSGGMQVGYNDLLGKQHMEEWTHIYLVQRKCKIGGGGGDDNATTQIHTMKWADLSPTYSHLPKDVVRSIALPSVTAGLVDLPNHQKG